MYLFLDIDGVLRPLDGIPGLLDAGCRQYFGAVMIKHSDWQIVLTSSWRLEQPLDYLQSLFPSKIRQQITAVTPQAEAKIGPYKQTEVEAYLASNDIEGSWLAIDDEPSLYAANAPIFSVDGKLGFTSSDAHDLHVKLSKIEQLRKQES